MITDNDKTKQELHNMINAIDAIIDMLTPEQLSVLRDILDRSYPKKVSKRSEKNDNSLDISKFEVVTPTNLDEIYTIRK